MQYGDLCTCCDDPVKTGSDAAHPLVTTFYYVQLSNVPFRVKYLDKFGNAIIDLDNDGDYRDDRDGELIPNSGANMEMVVTRNYRYRAGYVPDAFQKTLVLSANPESNVITFLYEKADGKLPYTIQYYYETLGAIVDDNNPNGKNYLLHHEVSGIADQKNLLKVDYLSITGYEYAMDIVTQFTAQDLSSKTDTPTTTRGDCNDINTGKASLELTDLRGHKITVTAQDGNVVFSSTDGHNHDLDNSIFTYRHNDVNYRVKAIRNTNGKLVIDSYADPTGQFEVTQGAFGTVIKVYYDLKQYPYYIIHRIDGGEELALQLGVAKFQSQISGTAMTDAALIQKGFTGYTAKDDDRTITVTMTIQDDGSTPHINTITFFYYEKMMEFDYVPMLLKNPGIGEEKAVVVQMPENEPNAQINLVRDYLKSVTGTPDAAHPIIYEDAYEFLGWYLDPQCTQAVANSGAALYLGTDCTQDSEGNSTLVNPLSGQGNMTQEEYKAYDTLLPQKLKTGYQYVDTNGDLTATNLEKGVYVGKFNGTTYDQHQTFYALFVPKLASLTITRTALGADFHNEANSFVYTIQRISNDGKDFIMQVSIGPEDFNDGTASVVITNLPLGKYTVTQEQNWSWRYTDEAAEITFASSELFQTATFGAPIAKETWLSGFADTLQNIFGIT